MNIKNVNAANIILQNILIEQMYIRDILNEKESEVSVGVYSKKHGTRRFEITRKEALILLEPRIAELEKKVETL